MVGVELLSDADERPLGEETGLAHGRQPNTCGWISAQNDPYGSPDWASGHFPYAMLPLHTAAPLGRQNTPSIISTLIHTVLPAHLEADVDPLASRTCEPDDEPLRLVFVLVSALEAELLLNDSLLPLADPLAESSSTEVDPLSLSSGDHLLGSIEAEGASGDHSFGSNGTDVLEVLGLKRGIWPSPPSLLMLLSWFPLEEEPDAEWATLLPVTSARYTTCHRCILAKVSESLKRRGTLNALRLQQQPTADFSQRSNLGMTLLVAVWILSASKLVSWILEVACRLRWR